MIVVQVGGVALQTDLPVVWRRQMTNGWERFLTDVRVARFWRALPAGLSVHVGELQNTKIERMRTPEINICIFFN